MTVDVFECKAHFDKYLKLSKKEDIYISLHGKIMAKLTNPYQNRPDKTEEAEREAKQAEEDFVIPPGFIIRQPPRS